MKLINIASGNSVWRGLDYYNENKISKYKQISNFEYEGKAKGSNNNVYNVFIDIEHPRKSKCDCPHAKDRRIICKHMVALYFTVFPHAVDIFLKEVEQAQQEYEEYENEQHEKVVQYIKTMSKNELQEALMEILELSPEWVYDRFVRDRIES